MLENEMIELMHEDASALFVSQRLEEVRVVDHLEVAVIIDTDTSSRDILVDLLLDASRERGEEWLRLK